MSLEGATMTLVRWLAAVLLAAPFLVHAQGGPPGGAPPAPPRSPREAAPVDLTGQWVAVVSEDYRWRMITPTRGDFQSIPLNPEGIRVGLEWDPARDEAAGQQCKSYGAPGLLRIPGRVRISWQDDSTLKIETDAGTQTRLLRFEAPAAASEPPSLQGYSVANWERPGYLRKNGPPYSASATVQEYFDHHVQPNGDEWFTVTTVVTDPTYLRGPFVTSSDFKKERDTRGWDPQPCAAR
jgi:hypothetical protein